MIGLTNLRSSGLPPMAPKLNHRRALFVLEKIDEILHWERTTERERDTRFVELGRSSAKCGPDNTGGWTTLSPLMSFWKRNFLNPGERLIT